MLNKGHRKRQSPAGPGSGSREQRAMLNCTRRVQSVTLRLGDMPQANQPRSATGRVEGRKRDADGPADQSPRPRHWDIWSWITLGMRASSALHSVEWHPWPCQLDASSTPPRPQVLTPENVFRHCQMSPGHTKPSPAGNWSYRSKETYQFFNGKTKLCCLEIHLSDKTL